MQFERVAQVVEAKTMTELRVQQTDRVTPGTERARLILHPSLQRNFGDLVGGNMIADLAQDVKPVPCWFDLFVFHPCRVAGSTPQANTFLEFLWDGCGRHCPSTLLGKFK